MSPFCICIWFHSLVILKIVTCTDSLIFIQAAFEAYLERELPEIRKDARRFIPYDVLSIDIWYYSIPG